MTISRTQSASAIAAVTISTLVANAGAPTHSWLNPMNGSWNTAANWDAGTVPNLSSDVLLGLSGPYLVTSGGNMQAGVLNIANPDATLQVDVGFTFDLNGDLMNDGLVIVNPSNGGAATQLDFESDSLISGSGEIRLGGASVRARLRSGAGVTVTQSANHSISGFGQIEAALVNNGSVDANITSNDLSLSFNDKTNNALMRASNGGKLTFSFITLSQGASGNVEAVGVGSVVEINNSTIDGGMLSTDASGLINALNCTLDGVSLTGGNMTIPVGFTLDVFNSITNNGTINVNPTNGGSATQLDFESSGSLLGSGQVVLGGTSVRARLRTGAGVTMTNSANHTIRGFGQIESSLINDGLISADVPSQSIVYSLNDKVNNSTMQSVLGGVTDISGVSIDQSGGGELVADGTGSELRFNSATVIGGDVRSINGGFSAIINAVFDGVTHSGDMQIPTGRTLDVFDSITNNGVISVNPTNGGAATQIDFESDGAFLGNGEVVLGGVNVRARLRTATDVSMTNSANHTIRGYGLIESTLINDGTIFADVTSQELGNSSGDKVNNAMMRAVNGAILDFGTIMVDQTGGGQIVADGASSRIDFNTTTIVGGTISTVSGGSVEVLNAEYDAVTSNASTTLPTGRILDVRNNVSNNSTIRVNPTNGGAATSVRWLDDSVLGGTGTIALEGVGIRSRLLLGGDATVATLGAGQRLEGIGNIGAPLTHNGTTAPGMSIGTMFASTPVTFTDSSVFEAEVDASTGDLLDSTSTIAVDGTLEVQFIDGFAPSGYWARKIMEGSSITGKFDAVVIPTPPAGFVTRVYNDGSNLFVGQTCPSDTNLDGALNFFDVSVFLNNYNSGNSAADLNGDGTLNFFDVSTFLNSYNMGC